MAERVGFEPTVRLAWSITRLASKAGMADRTDFTPETTSPERKERAQSPTKFNKITEAGLYPPAHNSLLAGSIPAVNAARECAT
jgi:hypothetical protein